MQQSRQLEKEERFFIFYVCTINLASNVMMTTWLCFELVCNIGATTKNMELTQPEKSVPDKRKMELLVGRIFVRNVPTVTDEVGFKSYSKNCVH